MKLGNRNLFIALATCQPATASIVSRTFANSSTCALLGMVSQKVAREIKATSGASRDLGYLPEPGPTIDAFNEERDRAQDDNADDHMIGIDAKLTLDQCVEWAAAIRAHAYAVADTLDRREARYGYPQDVKDSLVFLCTPDPKIGQDQIDAVREEEPEFTDEECIAEVRRIRIEDASAMKVNYAQILEDTLSALMHAPSDRELDAIWADLPEAYRDRLLDKAMDKIDTELLRTRKYAIQGVKGVSAKRKILKADTLILEPLQLGTA